MKKLRTGIYKEKISNPKLNKLKYISLQEDPFWRFKLHSTECFMCHTTHTYPARCIGYNCTQRKHTKIRDRWASTPFNCTYRCLLFVHSLFRKGVFKGWYEGLRECLGRVHKGSMDMRFTNKYFPFNALLILLLQMKKRVFPNFCVDRH